LGIIIKFLKRTHKAKSFLRLTLVILTRYAISMFTPAPRAHFNRNLFLIAPLVLPVFLFGLIVVRGVRLTAYADEPSFFTGCLSGTAGLFYNFAADTSPINPCPESDEEVVLGIGDITGVTAGDGLAGGGTSGDVTVSIANNSGDANRIQTWSNDSTQGFSATGGSHTTAGPVYDPSIEVVVPSGKAYYYQIVYDGIFSYEYADRTGASTSFYGLWEAAALSDTTEISPRVPIVGMGYRVAWSTVNNTWWMQPYHATWLVRLTEGTHDIKVQLFGYSDSTMDEGNVLFQRIQVMRIY
jgi:hypothetical protein